MPEVNRPATVLCIDDEVLGLEIRRVVLEREGYLVLTANDGPSALTLFRQNHIDAVVLDFAMPGMDGAKVARALREIKPNVPILLLSAYLSLPGDVAGLVDMIVNKGDGALPLIDKLKDLVAFGQKAR